jgi:hypothetical protein
MSMKKMTKKTLKKGGTKKPAPKKKAASKSSGRRVEVNNVVRSLPKVRGGSSYAITLPHAVVKAFKWKGRQKLKLVVNEKTQSITIKDWKK